jgi:hypothetical protein
MVAHMAWIKSQLGWKVYSRRELTIFLFTVLGLRARNLQPVLDFMHRLKFADVIGFRHGGER